MQGRFVKNGWGWEWYNLVEFMNLPENFGTAIMDGLKEHLTELADEIEEYAQENAPWQDRTGDARRGLKSQLIIRGDYFEIDLGHSVYYGYFLENYNGGEYAIIAPTLRLFAPQAATIAELGRTTGDDLFGSVE